MVAVVVSAIGASHGLPSVDPNTDIASNGYRAGNDAAFSEAIQAQRLPDVAAVPAAAPGMASHISAGLQDVSAKLASWHVNSSNEAIPTDHHHSFASSVPDNLTSAMAEAVSSLQGAYVFAIQATLVSRGSTEGTKILNTLLKGQ